MHRTRIGLQLVVGYEILHPESVGGEEKKSCKTAVMEMPGDQVRAVAYVDSGQLRAGLFTNDGKGVFSKNLFFGFHLAFGATELTIVTNQIQYCS